MFYWHHITGLVFGVVTLAFVASGLVSMHPWGFLESRGIAAERGRLEGTAPRWKAVETSLDALRAHAINAVHVSLSRSGGDLYWLATKADGGVTRLDATGNPAPVGDAELTTAAARLAGANGIAEQRLIGEPDTYFVGSGGKLPVYRVILKDDEQTRYYLDPNTGALVQRADTTGRWRRWLFSGLHRLDFAEWMRVRPFRDVLMWLTLLGGLAVSVTGVYLAVRRVRSDIIALLRPFRRFTVARREQKQTAS